MENNGAAVTGFVAYSDGSGAVALVVSGPFSYAANYTGRAVLSLVSGPGSFGNRARSVRAYHARAAESAFRAACASLPMSWHRARRAMYA